MTDASQIALWEGADAKPLRPFWRFYGGKWRSSLLYPQPKHGTLIEPFAGSAGYSLRYPDLNVILVEKYDVIAEIWRWLIGASPAEIRAIPEVANVDDLPAWVPAGGRPGAPPPRGSCPARASRRCARLRPRRPRSSRRRGPG